MRTVAVLYDAPVPAQVAIEALKGLGFPASDIAVLDRAAWPGPLRLPRLLAESGIPVAEGKLYAEGISRGGTLVVLTCPTVRASAAAQVLNALGAMDIEEFAESWRSEPSSLGHGDWPEPSYDGGAVRG